MACSSSTKRTRNNINMANFFPKTLKRFMQQSDVGSGMMPGLAYDATFNTGFESNSGAYSDPTYLGFKVHFKTAKNEALGGQDFEDFDTIPQGLLLHDQNRNSIQNYFKRIREPKKVDLTKRFRDGIFKIDTDLPWYIQSISGLDDLYKVDTHNNFRGSGKQISLTFLEDVKLQMTYLFDLYRKAVYDTEYMRWSAPQNMRTFSMDIYVVDIRNFQAINPSQVTDPNRAWQWFDPTRPQRAIDTLRGQLKGTIASVKQRLTTPNYGPEGTITNDPSNTSTPAERLPADDFLPILKFELEECEFNLIEDGLSGMDTMSNTVGENERNVELTINVGKIREVNQYTLFDIVLDDYMRTFKPIQVSGDLYQVAKDTDPGTDPGRTLINRQRKNPLLQKLKDRALQEVIGRVSGKFNELLNPLLLGNIYGLSPTDLQNTIENLLKNNKSEVLKLAGLTTGLEEPGEPGEPQPLNIGFDGDKKPKKVITPNIGLDGDGGGGVVSPKNIDFEEDEGRGESEIERRESIKEKPQPANISFSGPPSN